MIQATGIDFLAFLEDRDPDGTIGLSSAVDLELMKCGQGSHQLSKVFPAIFDTLKDFVRESGSTGLRVSRARNIGMIIDRNEMLLSIGALSGFLKLKDETVVKHLKTLGWKQVPESCLDVYRNMVNTHRLFQEVMGQEQRFQHRRCWRIWTLGQPDGSVEGPSELEMEKMKNRMLKTKVARAYLGMKQMRHTFRYAPSSKVKAVVVGSKHLEENEMAEEGETPNLAINLQVALVEELKKKTEDDVNGIHKSQRQYSEAMMKYASGLYSICPKSYRFLREGLPFPSERTVTEYIRLTKERVKYAVTSDDIEDLLEYLLAFRAEHNIGKDERPEVTLGFDATSASGTGIPAKGKKNGMCFAFFMLPHNRAFPDLLLHVMGHSSGHIDDTVRNKMLRLCEVLKAAGFDVNFVATDGDNGMNALHMTAFSTYETKGYNLWEITNNLPPLQRWPVSDFFHLLKNGRVRAARTKGEMHITANSPGTSGKKMSDELSLGPESPLRKDGPLDALKDDLALETFRLGNLLALGPSNDVVGQFFMLPFVSLNLAIRNPSLKPEARLSLIQVAFRCFRSMLANYPVTGVKHDIVEIESRSCPKKTIWSTSMCIRGCNLCVALFSSIRKWMTSDDGFQLALGRIGTHSVECHFGITRSSLRGEARLEKFVSAQVTAVLIQKLMRDLDIHPYIRRFKNVSGVTLVHDGEYSVDMDMSGLHSSVDSLFVVLGRSEDPERDVLWETIDFVGKEFSLLAERLDKDGYVEKVSRSSCTSGGSIAFRFFTPSKKEEEPKEEELDEEEEEDSVVVNEW
jgi:hypothetical protein